ncbi:hypothetical protein [Hyphomonas polymorpha]|uniref:hypothetical protein n=1 Tax=Hyphomonas polymorpha TaxID=74319 RepID=UPI000ABBF745|nr:hypothetical protein [Hyphomonas polymorpha]
MRPTTSDLLGEEPAEQGGDLANALVDRYTLAAVFGVAPSSISRFVANGILRRAEPGKFALAECVQAYVTMKAGKVPQGDVARRQKADADLAELKAAQMAGKLLDAREVEREWSATCRDLRAAILALPGRLSARLPHLGHADLAAVDSELREALAALGGADD